MKDQANKKKVVISFLGTEKDRGAKDHRHMRWRPSVALAKQPDLHFDRYEILYNAGYGEMVGAVATDISAASPGTEVTPHLVEMTDPWDFKEVYAQLLKFALAYPFDTAAEDYFFHITTGTHVVQVCLCKLVEENFLPGKLIQTSPSGHGRKAVGLDSAATATATATATAAEADQSIGVYQVIDLDVSTYADIAAELLHQKGKNASFLKSGIETKNADFNTLVAEIETVAAASPKTMLLGGPTGAGKTKLAKRIFELMKSLSLVKGAFVEVNCATLRGEMAMSALFGHVRGAFTGAVADRKGLLEEATGGLLFLDEVGELGADEQAALLRAIEEGVFRPVGSQKEKHSSFLLICGTNRDLAAEVQSGRFREDLLARINLWSFDLPGLTQRREDIEPNLDFELADAQSRLGRRIAMKADARAAYLAFALSEEATWKGNFRDLNGSVVRLATLSGKSGLIDLHAVHREVERLRKSWRTLGAPSRATFPSITQTASPMNAAGHFGTTELITDQDTALALQIGPEKASGLSPFERHSLAYHISVTRLHVSMAAAGRALYGNSGKNDADRLRKYFISHGLDAKEFLRRR